MITEAGDMLAFLLTKPAPKLRSEQLCAAEKLVDRGPGRAPGPCTRPVWGDGSGVQGAGGEGLCSRCWHEWNAFHGTYQTMRANPAAAQIDNEGLARLFITRGLDAEPLPEIGSQLADTFPADWRQAA